MEGCCPDCGYRLWAEEVPLTGRFRVWACFDDEKLSNTYTEQVQQCPGCDVWLNAELLSGAREKGT